MKLKVQDFNNLTLKELLSIEGIGRKTANRIIERRSKYTFNTIKDLLSVNGLGKTTLARIVAKIANCKNLKDGEPCLECDMCDLISKGKLLDVVELDAASHTQVENMRKLIEGVKYMPTQGKCKVFIIDEAHMLSKSSFGALLKTLEEPPKHVKFVLATTDPQKLPPTILSRCLCFTLAPLERGQIADGLKNILTSEKIEFDDDSVNTIARLGRGSMRDALSIMDQALSANSEKLEIDMIKRIVGEGDLSFIFDILLCISKNDASSIPDISRKLQSDGVGFDRALAQISSLLYKTSLFKIAPDGIETQEELAIVKKITPLFTEDQLQLLYEISVKGRKQMPWAPDEQIGFEMTLLRMALFSPCEITDSNTLLKAQPNV